MCMCMSMCVEVKELVCCEVVFKNEGKKLSK